MIGYINELDNSVINELKDYKFVLSGNTLWITNFIKIINYTKQEIKLKVKNNVLIISGVDINISMLDKKELILKGKFNSVSIEKPFKVVSENV